MRKAEFIAVGVVTSMNTLAQVAVTEDGTRSLRLQRINIRIENVVRGRQGGPDSIDYYVYERDHGRLEPGSWDYSELGHRYIFFLTKRQAVFRTVVDLHSSKIEVYSGRHGPFGERQSLRYTISKILLSPGQDVSLDRFSKRLSGATAGSISMIGYQHTYELIRPLLASADPGVRDGACLALVERLFGTTDCLSELSGQRSVALKGHALHLSDTLRTAISAGNLQPWGAPSGCQDQVADLLGLLAEVAAPQIREAALRQLTKRYGKLHPTCRP